MAEENKQTVKENKPVVEAEANEKVVKADEKKAEVKSEKAAEKKDDKKKAKTEAPKVKKEEAVARGLSLHLSKKHGMYLCSFVRNKKIDDAISDLEKVKLMKKAVPFKGEIPHRKGKGMMSGRYPVKGSGMFISMLKGLKGNVITNGMELEKTRISYASANWAARPARRGGRQAKRTNVLLKATEIMEAK